jgi:hypothetical protein
MNCLHINLGFRFVITRSLRTKRPGKDLRQTHFISLHLTHPQQLLRGFPQLPVTSLTVTEEGRCVDLKSQLLILRILKFPLFLYHLLLEHVFKS